MGGNHSRLRKLTLSLALAAALALAVPAFASAARVLYASGHDIDVGRLATFGGHTVLDPGNGQQPTDGFDGCSDAEWATALARTDVDVLIIGESAPSCLGTLSPSTLTAIRDYVEAGHPVIQSGAHNNEDEWLNAIFGFSTVHNASDSSEALTGTLQPGADGTPFAGGPPTVVSTDDSNFLGFTPGTKIYAGPEGTWVFMVDVGAGKLVYLAWDLCGEADGGCGNTSANEDDWYRVIDRAIQAVTSKPAPPAPPAPSDVCMGQHATIIGTSGNDNITGTPGADVIVALGGADKVNGGGGNDVICGRTGKDKLKGGAGNDKLQGNKAADRLIGNGGTDACRGGKGKDSAKSCESVKGL